VRRYALLALGSFGVVLGGCPRAERADDPSVPADTLQVAPPPRALSDAEVLHTLIGATEMVAAATARAEAAAEHVDVEVYAHVVNMDHAALQRAFVDLAASRAVEPTPNEVTRGLQEISNRVAAQLDDLEGSAFDRTFIEGEVAFHEAFIDAFDNRLVPSAREAYLRDLLRASRPTFEAHLQRAVQLRVELTDRTAADQEPAERPPAMRASPPAAPRADTSPARPPTDTAPPPTPRDTARSGSPFF
jgi:putative membrane protein